MKTSQSSSCALISHLDAGTVSTIVVGSLFLASLIWPDRILCFSPLFPAKMVEIPEIYENAMLEYNGLTQKKSTDLFGHLKRFRRCVHAPDLPVLLQHVLGLASPVILLRNLRDQAIRVGRQQLCCTLAVAELPPSALAQENV